MRHQTVSLAALAFACTLALTACEGFTALTPTPSPAPTTIATALPPPTAVPTLAATRPPPPTASPAPTALPAPTERPTAAPTALPAPTERPTVAPTAPARPPIGAEILFLRNAELIALDPATGVERKLAAEVSAFAATPDGRTIAMVIGQGAGLEIWLIDRDGTQLRRLTTNDRPESDLSWSPDGLSLAYTSGAEMQRRAPEWLSWSSSCAAAEIRVLDVSGGAERTIGAGCEPAFSPDGRRIAFASAPTAAAPGTNFTGANNAISIVNRMGENGWSVALADGLSPEAGLLVHGPAWSPDGAELAYQRFLGYQALTDINLTEAGSSLERAAAPIGFGVGWLLAPSYAPGGDRVVTIAYNFSDARGFSAYDVWQVRVLDLGGTEELALPSATLTLQAATIDRLDRATAAAWSPTGDALAVVLPTGWRPGLSSQEPVFAEPGPGELWRWRPGTPPEEKLAVGVDYGSPVLWLP